MSRLQKAFVGVGVAVALAIGSGAAFAQTAPAPPPDGATPSEGQAPPPATPAPDPAPDTKAAIASFFKGTEVGGLLDVNYDWYSTRQDGDALYRNFDTRHNQFRLGMAQLYITKAPSAESRVGFKLKVSGGPATNIVQSGEPGGPSVLNNIEEGYVSYLVPAGKGLQFDVGKFVTPLGAEVIEAKDNWNYSRSLLFSLAIPYYHSGVRMTYAPNAKLSLIGMVVNGWNNVNENNTAKTIGGEIAYKPSGSFSIVENYIAGPEQPANNDDWRQVSDTIATVTVNPAFSLMANYDYGKDTFAGEGVHWQGLAAYAKIQGKRVALSPRFEWYDDPQGASTGTPQTLNEFTTTFEVKATDTFLFRIEYRGDWSDSAVFKNGDGDYQKTQRSIAFGLLYSFSLKS